MPELQLKRKTSAMDRAMNAFNRKKVGLPRSDSPDKNAAFDTQVKLREVEELATKSDKDRETLRKFKKKMGLTEQPTRENPRPNRQGDVIEKLLRLRKSR